MLPCLTRFVETCLPEEVLVMYTDTVTEKGLHLHLVTVTHSSDEIINTAVTFLPALALQPLCCWISSVLLAVPLCCWISSVLLAVPLCCWISSVLLAVPLCCWISSVLLAVPLCCWISSVLLAVPLCCWISSVPLAVPLQQRAPTPHCQSGEVTALSVHGDVEQ